MNYKTKSCQSCEQNFQPRSGFQKFCNDCKAVHRADWFRKRDHERFLTPEGKSTSYARSREYWERTRLAALQAYGNRCVCCGETNVRFLTIDHINSDGAEHKRKTNGKSQKIARWLKANNYPDGFQVLCFNCNCGRALNGGICPHQGEYHE
jgi:hypothetical protein